MECFAYWRESNEIQFHLSEVFIECLLYIKYIAVGVDGSIKNTFNTKQNEINTINERCYKYHLGSEEEGHLLFQLNSHEKSAPPQILHSNTSRRVQSQESNGEAKEVSQEGRVNARWCLAKLITAFQETRWLFSHVDHLQRECKEQLSAYH